jgi:hypothetical protein
MAAPVRLSHKTVLPSAVGLGVAEGKLEGVEEGDGTTNVASDGKLVDAEMENR